MRIILVVARKIQNKIFAGEKYWEESSVRRVSTDQRLVRFVKWDFSLTISSRRRGNTLGARREHVTNRSHRGPRRDSIRWFPSPNSGWRAGGPDAAIIPRNDCHYREREGERAGGRTGQRDWPALRLRFCLVPLADKQRLRTSLLCSGRLRPQPASRCNFVASCHSISPLKTAFWNRSVPSFKRPAVKLFER